MQEQSLLRCRSWQHPHTRLVLGCAFAQVLSFAVIGSARAQVPHASQPPPTAEPASTEPPAIEPSLQGENEDLRKRITELDVKKSPAAAEAQTQRLMSAGFTVGYALGVSSDVPWQPGARQLYVNAISMPYFMALPFYWGESKALRDYCASAWVGGDEYTATEAAMLVARRAAELLVKSVKAALRAGIGDEQIHRELLRGISSADAALITTRLRLAIRTTDTIKAKKLEEDATAQLAMWEWNPSLKGKCGLRQIGIWAGVPLEFDATLRIDGKRMKATVSPVFATGVGYSPNSYFSFLLGITVANVEVEDTTRAVMTLVLAVGGNLDIIGALAR